MIHYDDDPASVSLTDVEPFFEGWATPPSLEQRVEMLQAAHGVVLARDETRLIGFATAVSDGRYWTYIPLLEVIAEYRARGVGTELMRRVIDRYGHVYGIDLSCEDELVGFYERVGMTRVSGMVIRQPGSFSL